MARRIDEELIARRKAARVRAVADAERPPCTDCIVVDEGGAIISRHGDILAGMAGLRKSPLYSILLSPEGVVFGRREPALGGGRKLSAVQERAIELAKNGAFTLPEKKEVNGHG